MFTELTLVPTFRIRYYVLYINYLGTIQVDLTVDMAMDLVVKLIHGAAVGRGGKQ